MPIGKDAPDARKATICPCRCPRRRPCPCKQATTCVLSCKCRLCYANSLCSTRYPGRTAYSNSNYTTVGGVCRSVAIATPAAGLSGQRYSGTAVLPFRSRTRSSAPIHVRHDSALWARAPPSVLDKRPLHRFFPWPASLPGAMHVNSTTATLNPQQLVAAVPSSPAP